MHYVSRDVSTIGKGIKESHGVSENREALPAVEDSTAANIGSQTLFGFLVQISVLQKEKACLKSDGKDPQMMIL